MYVQYTLFYMKYIEKKRYFSHYITIKKKNSWNFEKLINDIWMRIVFILIRKKGGNRWHIEKVLPQTLKVCKMREGLI